VSDGLTIGLFIGFVLLNYWLKGIRLLWLLIPIGISCTVARHFKSRAKRKRVCSYTYEQLFPFKVVLSKNENSLGNTYLHSKIYIIDDEIAYLGSLNFTGSGTKNNYFFRLKAIAAMSMTLCAPALPGTPIFLKQ